MSYRNDEDLNFLGELSNEELEPLLNLLMFDKDNKKRFTEQITSDVRYIKNTPNHSAYWDWYSLLKALQNPVRRMNRLT